MKKRIFFSQLSWNVDVEKKRCGDTEDILNEKMINNNRNQ